MLVLLLTCSCVCMMETFFSISITWPTKSFPLSLLRCGDIWWLLKSTAFLIMFNFVNSFFSLKYLLLEQQDCDTCVHYRKQCGLLSESSLERFQICNRLAWAAVLYWTGLFSVFFTCKIMFLEGMKKDTRDLLGVNPKILCLMIYQLGELEMWAHSPCDLHYSFQFLPGFA